MMRIAVVLVSMTLSGCGGSGDGASAPGSDTPTPLPSPSPTGTTTPPPSVEREVSPRTVDASVADDRFHVAISPAAPVKGRLVVMLPGTGGPPRGYRQFIRLGATRGYHAIGLAYDNELAVNDACPSSSDPDCAGNMRREIILGEDRSPLVTVAPSGAIVGRLVALLGYLHQTAPDEGWGGFLSAGQPDWSRITIAGQSQGSGHAGYMSKLFVLDRAVMFSGPGDLGAGGRGLAQWLSLPPMTPAGRLYGFIHRQDERVPVALAQAQWRALGLDAAGPAVEIDGVTPYAGPSHQLLTSVAPNPSGSTPSNSPYHGATVVDPVTPVTATGTPLFADTWTYLAFP